MVLLHGIFLQDANPHIRIKLAANQMTGKKHRPVKFRTNGDLTIFMPESGKMSRQYRGKTFFSYPEDR